jgi:hypothetical protein
MRTAIFPTSLIFPITRPAYVAIGHNFFPGKQ